MIIALSSKLWKVVKNTLSGILSRLIDLKLAELNPPEVEGYALYEPLSDINISSSSKSVPISSITVAKVGTEDHSNVMVNHDDDIEVHLSISPEKLINMQNDDTSCKTVMKFINENKLSSSERYIVNDKNLLHKLVREYNKSFHALVVLQAPIEYVLHHLYNDLGHNSTATT